MVSAASIKTIRLQGERVMNAGRARHRGLWFSVIEDSAVRACFDNALDKLHYAKSCQRVGRCMRLAVMLKSSWVGGIVLGSTFPNVDVRDRALGLKIFVNGYRERGLRNAWCAENREYWTALQTIVNH